jgi:hypothetical protein
MPKSYVESSSQTNQEDSNNHSHNEHRKSVSDSGIQTDECDPETLTRAHRDEDSDDASSIDHDGDLQRRFNPTRPDDFTTLQSELVQWRRREERKIAATGRNEGQKQEMTKLLMKKETHLLRKVDQLRSSATDKCKKERIRHVMELMSQPKQWEASDGFVIAVDTPETCRAREMKVMHDELNRAFDGGKNGSDQSISIYLYSTSCRSFRFISKLKRESIYSKKSRHSSTQSTTAVSPKT